VEREFCPKSLQDSKSLEHERAQAHPEKKLPGAGSSNLRAVRDRRQTKSRLQQS